MADSEFILDFGLYKIELNKVIQFFKEDLKDDWFQDPLLFHDRISKEMITEYFEQNIQTNHGVFTPIPKQIMNVPKKGSTLRYSLETCFFDRIAFHAFGITLIEHFDKLITRRVFNHRLDELSFQKGKSRWLFLNAIQQWKKYEEFVRVDAKDKTILRLDLQNYYENIRIDDLEKILLDCLNKIKVSSAEMAKTRFCINSICSCLKVWSYNGISGLPQNRDISSFLANIYMHPVDSFMITNGIDYYRYMDDVMIICENKFHARSILKKTIVELRKLGLNVNASKTSVLNPSTKEHSTFLERDPYELEKIDSMINSKRRPLVAMAFSECRERLIELINKGDFHSRPFRFLTGRMCKIALCKDIEKPTDFFNPITDGIIKNISEIPEATDQFYSYLQAVEMSAENLKDLQEYLLDEEKSIYGWQNYLLWKLLAYKNYHSPQLEGHAVKIMNSNSNVASIAGAVLYLGKCGNLSCKENIANNFVNFVEFFTQRHALISIQEVSYEIVKAKVESFVTAESRGIYRTLNALKTPKYIESPKNVKYTELIREVSFYE